MNQRRDADFDIKKYIKASNEIEGIYSEEEDAQSLLAWAYLEQLDSLSHADIMRVQKIITLHQETCSQINVGTTVAWQATITNVSIGGRKSHLIIH